MDDKLTQKNINLLLSGKHPQAKHFAGKNVMVSENEIILMKKGKETGKQVDRLLKKYKNPPEIVFVPKPGMTYIF